MSTRGVVVIEFEMGDDFQAGIEPAVQLARDLAELGPFKPKSIHAGIRDVADAVMEAFE